MSDTTKGLQQGLLMGETIHSGVHSYFFYVPEFSRLTLYHNCKQILH